MTDDQHEHYCAGCIHCPDSVDALQTRLAKLERAEAGDDITVEAWGGYFDAACRAVADVASLDLDAVTTILEGLTVVAGIAQTKGATARTAREERTKATRRPDGLPVKNDAVELRPNVGQDGMWQEEPGGPMRSTRANCLTCGTRTEISAIHNGRCLFCLYQSAERHGLDTTPSQLRPEHLEGPVEPKTAAATTREAS